MVIQKNWQELIKPNKLEVAQGDDPKRVATLVAEPLERGFGMTLGNALRRVLLSSLQGAAVTSVHIDGVLHEFSSIPGVREDVTDIVLNIKTIAIKMQGEGTKRMTLRKTGPGVVTAGDIRRRRRRADPQPRPRALHPRRGRRDPHGVHGRDRQGLRPLRAQPPRGRADRADPGRVLYSARSRRSSYRVENTREGQILDYDKLTMTIETNGAMSPEDAVAYAARIMQDQLQIFVNFEEPRKEEAPASSRRSCPSTRRCSRRSTSSSSRSARRTA